MDQLTFIAHYGAFDNDMVASEVIDVTSIVREKFLLADHIKIPVKTNFNKYFGDPSIGKRKFLQISTGTRVHNIADDNYKLDIDIDLHKPDKKIKLVYYAYINRNGDWKTIVEGQLEQLKSYGLFDESDLYVHVTDTTDQFDDVITLIKGICAEAKISTSKENYFEYPAIRLIYDLALKHPESIFIYLHTKGMSNQIGSSRIIDEVTLLSATFKNWRYNLQFLEAEHMNKMGLFSAMSDNEHPETRLPIGGWIWFNFWYAKGAYLSNCDEPEITENRFYFEHWLALQKGPLVFKDDCHDLYVGKKSWFFKKKKKYLTSVEAFTELQHLIRRNSKRYKS